MECYSVLAFCYNKYKKYVNKEDKMKTLTLQYTISQKGWTDLRQNGKISIDEQSYLLNAIRTQDQYFKNIYRKRLLKIRCQKQRSQFWLKRYRSLVHHFQSM